MEDPPAESGAEAAAEEPVPEPGTTAEAETPEAEEPTEASPTTLPLTEDSVTLTWFTSLLSANDRVYLPTMADNEALKHLIEITGVTDDTRELKL